MSRRSKELQKLVRMYKQQTGVADVESHEVAAWAAKRGYRMPKPPTEEQLLARQLSRAMREETRVDPESGLTYRVNHPYPSEENGEKCMRWFDIDEKPLREKMDKSMKLRRQQMVGDAVQLSKDVARWNQPGSCNRGSCPPESGPGGRLGMPPRGAWRRSHEAEAVHRGPDRRHSA